MNFRIIEKDRRKLPWINERKFYMNGISGTDTEIIYTLKKSLHQKQF